MGLLYLFIVPCLTTLQILPKPQAADVTVITFQRLVLDSRRGSAHTEQMEFGNWQRVILRAEIGDY
jgi:hypothetical protein